LKKKMRQTEDEFEAALVREEVYKDQIKLLKSQIQMREKKCGNKACVFMTEIMVALAIIVSVQKCL